ncbi:RidA family protein [Emcibacter nanhaiensis]|uniref:RidA family protein n=1 Tax=Emcibacter nanhaiensis TaxID=1505037 RepID=A0A501PFY4_9PROT|nr:RidA family protein [Emcibacter nanhaiensis]TPD57943.1 RidA family protein [Emcibacter nanhaiensis]TPD58874.1 RidA family protein [Emcibacter nanhaiensis]TPD59604.1 RidA family protein [Emcibacter nanhaiensis]
MTIERLGRPPVLADGTVVPLSPAIKAGNNLYLSGVLPFRADGSFAEDDISAQTRQCLGNMEAVLKAAGAGLEDVVKVTVWLVRREDFRAFNAVYSEFFADCPPTRSTVCSELMVPGALIEIEAVAYLDRV